MVLQLQGFYLKLKKFSPNHILFLFLQYTKNCMLTIILHQVVKYLFTFANSLFSKEKKFFIQIRFLSKLSYLKLFD